tara:strand:+ start:183 stop:1193 length:1011 start_codon:yes stop_codon:yes gene_type:complete
VKIVFWGTPKYAAENLLNIVNAGYEVIAVVTQPDRRRGRGKKLTPSPVKQAAVDLGLRVLATESIRMDQITKDILIGLNADVFVVVAFGQILPKEILDIPKLGCWNSHASLLPLWRGAAPIQWSIINGDEKTGICIMSMEEGLDTGPIVEQESTVIHDSDNLEILTDRLSKISSRLLVKFLKRLSQNNSLNKYNILEKLSAIDQSKSPLIPTYARQIKKVDCLINWNYKAITIIKKINGLYPNAYTLYNSKRIKILAANIVFNSEEFLDPYNSDIESIEDKIPGQIILINKQVGILIKSDDYMIKVNYAQLEGRRITDSYTLSIQADLEVNKILGN